LMKGSWGFAEEEMSECVEKRSGIAHTYAYIDA
jgi:hypothetical protein